MHGLPRAGRERAGVGVHRGRDVLAVERDVERGEADARERVSAVGGIFRGRRPAAHEERLHRRVRQHVGRHREAHGRRRAVRRLRRFPQHAVPHDGQVQLGVGERRLHQRGRGVAGLVCRLVELDGEHRRIAPEPRRLAAAAHERDDVGRARVVFRAGHVRAHAIGAGLGRREREAHGFVARRGVAARDGGVRHGLHGLLRAFDDLRRVGVHRVLQLDVHVRSRAHGPARVGRDHVDRQRPARRADVVGLHAEQRVARERGEQLAVGDGDVRGVGRLRVDLIRHRVRQIARDRNAHAALPVGVDGRGRLEDVGRRVGLLLGPVPLAAEAELLAALRREARGRARDGELRGRAGERRAEQIRVGRRRGHRIAARRDLAVEREIHFEVGRLELRDAQVAEDLLAVARARAQGVIAERRVFGNHDGDRERAERVERAPAQVALLVVGHFQRDRVRRRDAAAQHAVHQEPAGGGHLRGLAGLVEVAVREDRAARERRRRRPAVVEVARVGAAVLAAAHVRPVGPLAHDRHERRRLVLSFVRRGAAREPGSAERRHAGGRGGSGRARDRRGLRRQFGLRRVHLDLRACDRRAVGDAVDVHVAFAGEPLREHAEIGELHDARRDERFFVRRALCEDGVREHARRRAELRAQRHLDRALDVLRTRRVEVRPRFARAEHFAAIGRAAGVGIQHDVVRAAARGTSRARRAAG